MWKEYPVCCRHRYCKVNVWAPSLRHVAILLCCGFYGQGSDCVTINIHVLLMRSHKHNFGWCFTVFNSWQLWITSAFIRSIVLSSGAGIVPWYSAGLGAGWSEVRFPAVGENFPLRHRVQTGSGAHPASYSMGTRGSFPGAWSWPFTSM
jgi:hypothetical protein